MKLNEVNCLLRKDKIKNIREFYIKYVYTGEFDNKTAKYFLGKKYNVSGRTIDRYRKEVIK